MGTFIQKKENHRCLDDCRMGGCPGHTLELHYQTCADVITLMKDDKLAVGLDIGEFESFIEMCMNIGPLAEIIKSYVD